ncbi:5755_t:CDS:2 [Cetraspora pellucida]|uniref:5755_t:CDS:1 n=1 Tax=Cetraspora pellucida TaxID=1433469 RepID=A0A9N8WAP3_9GLOM|nr:5755_t:CDS:2 [Cetraspora pellucida]
MSIICSRPDNVLKPSLCICKNQLYGALLNNRYGKSETMEIRQTCTTNTSSDYGYKMDAKKYKDKEWMSRFETFSDNLDISHRYCSPRINGSITRP